MTSPSEDVYKAAARLLPEVEIGCPDPQCNDSTWDHECTWSTRPNHELAKRVVDGLWPLIHAAGVADGRAQAAADIRALEEDQTPFPTDLRHSPYWSNLSGPWDEGYTEWHARIAEGGEPRG